MTTQTGQGRASQLGRFTMTATYCVDGATGDHGDGVVSSSPPTATPCTRRSRRARPRRWTPTPCAWPSWTTLTVRGGTGRFAGLSGAATEAGVIDALTGEWTMEIQGTLGR